MKITIVYDNELWEKDLIADWGFSCLVEAYGHRILFDTGANGQILLNNMKKLDINPSLVDEIFISHSHWDHTGGLADFLKINPVKVYLPWSCPDPSSDGEFVKVKEPLEIHENIFSTGELSHIEQSLVIKREEDVVVIAGCSHPGVREILQQASRIGEVSTLIGGLHGFDEFELINNLQRICATHCTQYQEKIKTLYPDKYIEGGGGRVIEI